MDMENMLAKMSDNVSVRRAFGTAYEKEGILIIPVAIVAGGGGGGTASSRRGNPSENTVPRDPGSMDAGGGLGGLVLPSGAYVVKGDKVRWVPAVDTTILVLASLGLARMLTRAWTRRRGDRKRS